MNWHRCCCTAAAIAAAPAATPLLPPPPLQPLRPLPPQTSASATRSRPNSKPLQTSLACAACPPQGQLHLSPAAAGLSLTARGLRRISAGRSGARFPAAQAFVACRPPLSPPPGLVTVLVSAPVLCLYFFLASHFPRVVTTPLHPQGLRSPVRSLPLLVPRSPVPVRQATPVPTPKKPAAGPRPLPGSRRRGRGSAARHQRGEATPRGTRPRLPPR